MKALNNLSPRASSILNDIVSKLVHLEQLLDAEELQAYEACIIYKAIEKTLEQAQPDSFLRQAIASIEYAYPDIEERKSRGIELVQGRTLYDYSLAASTYQPYQEALLQKKMADEAVKSLEKQLVANLRQADKYAMYDKDTGEELPVASVKGYSKPVVKMKL